MNFLKELITKKKNRLRDAGYNLDLTYITPRIIGMAFPGSGIETTYRNNIKDVANFLNERHGENYYVYNLSGRTYDYTKFNGRVNDYEWEDHHSPPIATLFQMCKHIFDYLESNPRNIISVHCLAGKGRTGTGICCYLLYSGLFNNVQEVLTYYARKRFLSGGAVTQPSQIRYIEYFFQVMKDWNRTPILKYISSITMNGVPIMSRAKKGCKPFIEIYSVRDKKLVKFLIKLYTDKTTLDEQREFTDMDSEEFNQISVQVLTPFAALGDVLIRVLHHSFGFKLGRLKNKLIFRLAFNTTFVSEEKYSFNLVH